MLRLLVVSLTLALALAYHPQLKVQQHYNGYKGGGRTEIFDKSQVLPGNWQNIVSVVKSIEGNWLLIDKKGRQREVHDGEEVSLRGDWNDVLKEIKIMPHPRLRIQQHYNGYLGGGKSEVFDKSGVLPGNWQNCVSVAESLEGDWILIDKNGRQRFVGDGEEVSLNGDWNDVLKDIRVDPKFKLRLQQHYNGYKNGGRSEVFGKPGVIPANWQNTVSVVESEKGAWELIDKNGRHRSVGDGQEVSLNGDWNDVLKEIRIKF